MTTRRRPRNPFSDPRRSRAWRKLVAQVCRDQPMCWLRLPGCTGRSTTADHVELYKHRPDLAMVRENLRGACRSCNGRRGDTPWWKLKELRQQLELKQKPARALSFFETEGE